MYEGVDTVVLYDELACHDVLPVQWKPLALPLERFELIGLEESNQLLLQACIAVEEHPARDKKSEDLDPIAGELARLDFKLNIVLQLLSRLVPSERIAAPTTVQFNAHGASWTVAGPTPALGERGLLRIQLRRSLPQPLELPGVVSAVHGATVSVKFAELGESTVQLMQKLAFLRHRRHIADARKARG